MTTADRYLMISADCHAAPRLDDVREYVDPAWRESFDSWRAQLADRGTGRLGEPLFDEQAREDFRDDAAVCEGAMRGIWDSEHRLRELRAEVELKVIEANTVRAEGEKKLARLRSYF